MPRIIIAGGGGGIGQIFELRHPRTGPVHLRRVCATQARVCTGAPAMFTLSKDKVLLEVQLVDGAESSWFLDESVVSGH